jgi:hypothetical protein
MNTLLKIFTSRYYITNTGFFLLIFYFFFGIVPGEQLPSYHYAMMKGITGSLDFLALALFIWGAYNLKCMAFVIKTLTARDGLFLYSTVGLLQGPRKWRTWLTLHTSIYAPVLIYSLLAMVVAVTQQHYLPALIILLFNAAMLTWPLTVYNRRLQQPGATNFFTRLQEKMNVSFRKPFWTFYIYELLNNNARSFILTKVVSAIILIATCSYMGSQYDERMVLLGLLLVLLTHSVIIFNHRRFEDLLLPMLPQLPIPLWRRFVQHAFTYIALLTPEMILLIIKTNIIHLPLYLICGLSLLLLMRSLLYIPGIDQDKYFRWVLIIFAVFLFLILAHLYWPAIAAVLTPAFLLFYLRYYRYEPPLEEIE